MDGITYEKVVERLQAKIPEFRADDEDVRDNLVHIVFEDLIRFVKTTIDTNSNDELLKRIFGFIEEAVINRDIRVRDAFRDSFLEGLADSPDHLQKAKPYMGGATRELLREARAYLNP